MPNVTGVNNPHFPHDPSSKEPKHLASDKITGSQFQHDKSLSSGDVLDDFTNVLKKLVEYSKQASAASPSLPSKNDLINMRLELKSLLDRAEKESNLSPLEKKILNDAIGGMIGCESLDLSEPENIIIYRASLDCILGRVEAVQDSIKFKKSSTKPMSDSQMNVHCLKTILKYLFGDIRNSPDRKFSDYAKYIQTALLREILQDPTLTSDQKGLIKEIQEEFQKVFQYLDEQNMKTITALLEKLDDSFGTKKLAAD